MKVECRDQSKHCRVCGRWLPDNSWCWNCMNRHDEDTKQFKDEILKLGIAPLEFGIWFELKVISQQLERNEISDEDAAPLIKKWINEAREEKRRSEEARKAEEQKQAQSTKMVSRMSSIMHNRFLD